MMRYTAHRETACAALDGGAVVLHLGTKRYYSLNESGAVVWRLFEAGTTEGDAATRLTELYTVDLAEARQSVVCLVAELLAEDLIEETLV